MMLRQAHAVLAIVVLSSGISLPAFGDTVYLKNGRVIRSSEARVVGERVVVLLYGGTPDDAPDAASTTPDEPASDPDTAIPPAAPDAGAAPGPTPPEPEQTRPYWQARVAPLRAQLDRLDAQLRALRSGVGADVDARAARLEASRDTVEEQLDDLIREARRRGIPRGWLR